VVGAATVLHRRGGRAAVAVSVGRGWWRSRSAVSDGPIRLVETAAKPKAEARRVAQVSRHRATWGPGNGLDPGVIIGAAPPGGRAVGDDAPIATTSLLALARLARSYRPTVEVTIADRIWPVSVSSCSRSRGLAVTARSASSLGAPARGAR